MSLASLLGTAIGGLMKLAPVDGERRTYVRQPGEGAKRAEERLAAHRALWDDMPNPAGRTKYNRKNIVERRTERFLKGLKHLSPDQRVEVIRTAPAHIQEKFQEYWSS